MTQTDDLIKRKNFTENKKLCEENPDVFMICPRCWGTKFVWWSTVTDLKMCKYCGGEGVITWIDRIMRGKKNPFTDGK